MGIDSASVCFLITDIEGSTALLDRAPSAYAEALQIHNAIIREETESRSGTEFHEAGDSLFLAFPTVPDAVAAALAIQARLDATARPGHFGPLRVRMGLHVGPAEFREGQYRGPALNAAVRICQSAHGGQILCSGPVASGLPDGVAPAKPLGTYRLRGLRATCAMFRIPHGASGDGDDSPPRTAHARTHNLPLDPAPIVGREAELARCAELFDADTKRGALVALTGTGGVGKSRLAMAVARSALDRFDHAVFWVPLVAATRAEGIADAILHAVGGRLDESKDRPGQLAERLGGSPALAVLDNIEQLGAEGVAAIDALRRGVPGLSILVTSRARLNLPGAHEVPVEPFPPPETGPRSLPGAMGHPAIRLFVERARLVRPELELDAQSVSAIAKICRVVSGLPLAIELAAARLQVMGVEELLDALSGGSALLDDGAEPGGKGLAEVVAWSAGMLPPDVVRFLAELTVFRGSLGADAAAAVCCGGDERIARGYLHFLLSCSLVRLASERGRHLRFALLEPIRQVVAKANPEPVAGAEKRHWAFFRELATRGRSSSGTARKSEMTEAIETDWANLMVAITRSATPEEKLQLAAELFWFARANGHCLELRPFLPREGDTFDSIRDSVVGLGWQAAADNDSVTGHDAVALREFQRAHEIAVSTKWAQFEAVVSNNWANVLRHVGQFDHALELYGRCLEYQRKQGTPYAVSSTLCGIAGVKSRLGILDEADADLAEAMRLIAPSDFPIFFGHLHNSLGNLALLRGDDVRAKSELMLSLDFLAHAHETNATITARNIATLSGRFDRWEQAARIVGLVIRIGATHGVAHQAPDEFDDLIRDCKGHLGDERFEELAEEGEEMTLDELRNILVDIPVPTE
jgi:predicted ATPase/class 3 adenylate cyclase